MSAAVNERTPQQLPIPPESAAYGAVVQHARLLGWRVHHQRSTAHGTPVQGDPGFPDFVLVHPRGHVLFVELKSDRKAAKLTSEQAAWGQALLDAGARWMTVRVPSQLGELLQLMTDLALVS